MADAYDFQIESMKFRLATSDKFPYSRGTAPYRKDQFDSSPTVGDQSLTGWWTRGQLSFHKGAGLNYYEVLESDEVINRFTSSRFCDVFEPGRVTLRKSFTQLTTTGPVYSVCAGRNNGLFYMDGNGGSADTFKGTSGNGTYTTFDITLGGYTTEVWTGGTTVIGDYAYTTYQMGGPIYGIARGFWDYPTTTDFTFEDPVYETASVAWAQIWGTKARLWALSAQGVLYAMAPYPSGATPSSAIGSPVAQMPVPYNDAPWYASLTDGGSAVFMTMGDNHVYAFSLNSDGSVPTLSAPVVVAELPNGEDIQVIRAHLGYLMLVTSKGVRFAAIFGTEITVGPLVVQWDGGTTCERIAAIGARVYCTGVTVANTSLGAFEFDLSEPVGSNPLIFPYAQIWHGTTGYVVGTDTSGCVEHGPDGGLALYAGNSLWTNRLATTKESTGYVITAYHRFGTLDKKNFRKITVRAEGTGTIQVIQVSASGTETSLGTMNASAGEVTYALTVGAAERVAFKFVLNRDGADTTKGPTLLGYQVKALPVPERQRILKIPLLVQDRVRLRRGSEVGKTGKAYSDITTLEGLETSQAIVAFTDHRTGETGSAYIDSVEFQGDTPSTATSNGFGGIAYVTLRVLS